MLLRYAMAVMFLFAGCALAHHAEGGFDRTRVISVTGTVKQFLWANPHAQIYLEVTDSNGSTDVDVFYGGSVIVMRRSGWSQGSLKVGDKLTIDFYPRRDHKRGGMWITVTKTNGEKLVWPQPAKP